MQQPIIFFNGKQYKVVLVRFADSKPIHAIAIVDKIAVDFYDIFHGDFINKNDGFITNLQENLIFAPSTINKLTDGIKRKIEAHEEVICDMSIDFVESFREARKAPFASDGLLEQANAIERLGYLVDGLHEALGVVLMKGDSDV